MLSKYKEAAKVKTMDGKTVLHFAVSSQPNAASIEVINALIEIYPESIGEKEYKNQSFPLHYACAFKASYTIVDVLTRLYPYITVEKDNSGNIPLHLALIYGAETAIIKKMLKISPEAASITDGSNRLPLFLGCQYHATAEAIFTIISAYPPALYVKDNFGLYPINIALKYKQSAEVIEHILQNDETIPIKGRKLPSDDHLDVQLWEENSYEKLLLHSAIEYNCPTEIIKLILRIAPYSSRQLTSDGKLPIHYAAWRTCQSVAIVKTLIKSYAEGLMIKEKNYHNLPLHYAAQYNLNLEAANAILSNNVAAAFEVNGAGKLPIHIAAQYHSDPLFMNALIKAHPFAVGISDRRCRLPIDYALQYDASAQIIVLLLGVKKMKKKKSKVAAVSNTTPKISSPIITQHNDLLSSPPPKIMLDDDADDDEDEEELEKIEHTVKTASVRGHGGEEEVLLKFGKGAVDHHGKIKFDGNDEAHGDRIAVATVTLGSGGVKGAVQALQLQIKEQQEKIIKQEKLIKQLKNEIETKDMKMHHLEEELNFAKERIERTNLKLDRT